MTQTVRGGQLTMRGWPKERGPHKDPDMQMLSRSYADAQRHSTRPHPYDHLAAYSITDGTMWNWREAIVKGLYGNLVEIYLPGGVRLASWNTMATEVQALLDTISMSPGTMLIRGENQWIALEPGAENDVLTSAGPDGLPFWDPLEIPIQESGQWAWLGASGTITQNAYTKALMFNINMPYIIKRVMVLPLTSQQYTFKATLWEYPSTVITAFIDETDPVTGIYDQTHPCELVFKNQPLMSPTGRKSLCITSLGTGSGAAWTCVSSAQSYGGMPASGTITFFYGNVIPAIGTGLTNGGGAGPVAAAKWDM